MKSNVLAGEDHVMHQLTHYSYRLRIDVLVKELQKFVQKNKASVIGTDTCLGYVSLLNSWIFLLQLLTVVIVRDKTLKNSVIFYVL